MYISVKLSTLGSPMPLFPVNISMGLLWLVGHVIFNDSYLSIRKNIFLLFIEWNSLKLMSLDPVFWHDYIEQLCNRRKIISISQIFSCETLFETCFIIIITTQIWFSNYMNMNYWIWHDQPIITNLLISWRGKGALGALKF